MLYPAGDFSGVKIQKFRKGDFWILERKGGQGDMPSASQFSQASTWKKLGEIEACGRPQAVLAISPCVMTRAVLAILVNNS